MNGNGKWWLELLKVVGLPGALVAYLIYWLTVRFDAKLDIMNAAIIQLAQAVDRLAR